MKIRLYLAAPVVLVCAGMPAAGCGSSSGPNGARQATVTANAGRKMPGGPSPGLNPQWHGRASGGVCSKAK